jgi:hypothetical protein
MRSGAVKCWGAGGALGDGKTVSHPRPVAVIGFGPRAAVAIVSGSVRVTPARFATLRLRCGSQARCRGTLSLASARLELGSSTFSIGAGRTQAVAVRLTARSFKLLARRNRLVARARVRYQQPDGGATTRTRTITLTAPRR